MVAWDKWRKQHGFDFGYGASNHFVRISPAQSWDLWRQDQQAQKLARMAGDLQVLYKYAEIRGAPVRTNELLLQKPYRWLEEEACTIQAGGVEP